MILPRRVYTISILDVVSYGDSGQKKIQASPPWNLKIITSKRENPFATNVQLPNLAFSGGPLTKTPKNNEKKPVVLGLHHPSFSMLLAIPTSKAILDSSPFFLQTGLQVAGVGGPVKHQDHQVGPKNQS